jgi:hypothetical protein
MTLLDGLDYYKTYSKSDWSRTLEVEASAVKVVKLIRECGGMPSSANLRAAYDLLLDIEQWKAMCLRDRMGNAGQNPESVVWDAFRGALTAQTDRDCLLSIMRLKGFGASSDEETCQRRAKVATAALRFLQPDEWGVVDWRTAAILGLLEKSKGDVDQALVLARPWKADDLRKNVYEMIDEKAACEYNQMYRSMRTPSALPRTVDIEMALFGLSMKAWPFPT